MASITEFIKNIRNARLGKDVRESIASAIEQTYEDATEKGSSNMEVAQARGAFNTLRERLNNSDSVKADKTTTNNLQNQINSLASGSPLVASSVSEMTDTSKVYVNTADGHWYTYNGTDWIDNGVYQASEYIIKEDEINYFQTDNIKTSRNLLTNIENLTLMGNLKWQIHDSFKTTKLIPIDDTKQYLIQNLLAYYFNKPQHIYIFEYTSQTAQPSLFNNNVISMVKNYQYVPSLGTKFIRITFRLLEWMIEDQSLDINNIISNYLNDFNSLDYMFFGEGVINKLPEKRYFKFNIEKNKKLIDIGTNLINKNDLLPFNYSGFNIRWDLYPQYKTTNLIKLDIGEDYTLSLDNGNITAYLKFLDENLVLQTSSAISLDSNNPPRVNSYTFTAEMPYLIITSTHIDTLMLAKSSEKINRLPFVYNNEAFEFLLNRINNMENPVFPLKGKTILFAGDSICYGYSFANGYAGIIQNNEYINYDNIAISGTTISKRNNRTDSILEKLQSNENTNYDFIIAEGGINDGGSANIAIGNITEGYNDELNEFTYCGAMESLCKTLLTKYYNSKVGFVFCHNVKNRTNQNNYFEKGIEICKKWGIPYIDLRNYMNCNIENICDNYTSDDNNDNVYDGLHPNESGYKKYYAPLITNFIKTLE